MNVHDRGIVPTWIWSTQLLPASNMTSVKGGSIVLDRYSGVKLDGSEWLWKTQKVPHRSCRCRRSIPLSTHQSLAVRAEPPAYKKTKYLSKTTAASLGIEHTMENTTPSRPFTAWRSDVHIYSTYIPKSGYLSGYSKAWTWKYTINQWRRRKPEPASKMAYLASNHML